MTATRRRANNQGKETEMHPRKAVTALAAAAALLAAGTAGAETNLVYSTYVSQGSSSNLQYEGYLEELSRRTDGAVKVQDKMYMCLSLQRTKPLFAIHFICNSFHLQFV